MDLYWTIYTPNIITLETLGMTWVFYNAYIFQKIQVWSPAHTWWVATTSKSSSCGPMASMDSHILMVHINSYTHTINVKKNINLKAESIQRRVCQGQNISRFWNWVFFWYFCKRHQLKEHSMLMHFSDAKPYFVVDKRRNAKPCPEKSDFKCHNSVMFKLAMRQHLQYNLLFHSSPYTQAARRVVSCLILHTVFLFYFFF